MKFLKYLLAIIILLAILFFLSGVIKPNVSYESTVTVKKSIQESWAVMSDTSKMSQWLEGFKKTELVSGTANTVGAVSKVYIDNNGQETIIEETVTKIIPDQQLNMSFTMDFMDMDYEMVLTKVGDGTKIVTKSTVAGNGAMAKSIVSFMGKAMKTQEDKNLGNLKKLIDKNGEDYFKAANVYKSEETVQ